MRLMQVALKGVSLVINDIQSDSKHYGYGEKYGYTSDKKRSKKHLFKRKKGNNTIGTSN